jgi:DNA-binding NarL/FixJ family response regulator
VITGTETCDDEVVMQSLRVLLVDDNRAFLDLAARELATDMRVHVVGAMQSAEEALIQVQNLHPDLVLLDISLPRMNGLEATRQIKRWARAPWVVLVTIHDWPDYRAAGIAAGADGFIAKEEFDMQISALIGRLFDDLHCAPG